MSQRVLCLGNSLLADDAFGFAVAEQLRRDQPGLDVVESSAAGFDLLDCAVGATRLVVVDTFQTGSAPPGSVHIFRESDVRPAAGCAPHYVGLFEALQLGKALALALPEEVTILAVEPADCLTVGGTMHPAVRAAVGAVADLVRKLTA
ncbi:MAG: hydrogenase maturation protease [Acidobacteria bacterium]|nr:hydrogenase maturation protease [Acidobacteriota bacterium]